MSSQNENFVDGMEATNSDPGNQNRLNQIAKKYPNANVKGETTFDDLMGIMMETEFQFGNDHSFKLVHLLGEPSQKRIPAMCHWLHKPLMVEQGELVEFRLVEKKMGLTGDLHIMGQLVEALQNIFEESENECSYHIMFKKYVPNGPKDLEKSSNAKSLPFGLPQKTNAKIRKRNPKTKEFFLVCVRLIGGVRACGGNTTNCMPEKLKGFSLQIEVRRIPGKNAEWSKAEIEKFFA